MTSANKKHRVIINEILNSVHKSNESVNVGNTYFLGDPGGIGKTFIYQCN